MDRSPKFTSRHVRGGDASLPPVRVGTEKQCKSHSTQQTLASFRGNLAPESTAAICALQDQSVLTSSGLTTI